MSRDKELLGQSLTRETTRLYGAARVALLGASEVEAAWIHERLQDPQYDVIRVVATGLYSSGKSTILKALTGDPSIVIDSDITTFESASYRWNSMIVVDTPGVRAGVPAHDEEARRELRQADFVLFVVTVGLLDDDALDHLEYVARTLERSRQTIVVLNKTTLSAAEPSVREAAVSSLLDRLGLQLPLVMIDARDQLDSMLATDPQDVLELSARSNFGALVDEMNAMAVRNGTYARLATPLINLLGTIEEAEVHLTQPGPELDLRRWLAARSNLLDAARLRLLTRIATLESIERQRIEDLGSDLASSLTFEGGPVSPEKVAEFEAKATQRAMALCQAVIDEYQTIADWFELQGRQIEGGPAGLGMGRWASELDVELNVEVPIADPGLSAQAPSGDWSRRAEELKKRAPAIVDASQWIAKQMADPRGGAGHAWILKMGHKVGHKFRPYEAVRWAGRIGKAAEIASKWMPLVAVAAEGAAQVLDERQEHQRLEQLRAAQSEIRREVDAAADYLIQEVRSATIPSIEDQFAETRRPWTNLLDELDAAEQGRDATRLACARILSEARSLLDQLESSTELGGLPLD